MANVNFFSPDGGTTRYPIEDTEARSRVAGQQSLLKDTVGWTGKNLLKNTTTTHIVSGVTITANADGTVKINGTATSDIIEEIGRFAYIDNTVILSGCPTGGAWNTYRLDIRNDSNVQYGNYIDTGSGVEFTPDSSYLKVCIRIANGTTVNNLTFYPMLRKADITDPTYEPYHESVEEEIEQIYADNGVLGAKNLLPNNVTSQTINGVTFTVNSDGSITANGTATANTDLAIAELSDAFAPPAGEYIISRGGVSSQTNVQLYVNLFNGSTRVRQITNLYSDNKCKFTLNYDGYDRINIGIWVDNGKTVSNFIIYPMLRLASDPDDTYQPYAMTNRELTEKVFEKRALTSADDLNNIKETGVYGISTAPVNSPNNLTYSTLIVQANDANNLRQIIYSSGNDWGSIYVRSFRGNPADWTSWYKFTGTVVS